LLAASVGKDSGVEVLAVFAQLVVDVRHELVQEGYFTRAQASIDVIVDVVSHPSLGLRVSTQRGEFIAEAAHLAIPGNVERMSGLPRDLGLA